MLRVLGVVVSIGLADSMNPSTIAPALYLAAGKAPVRNLIEFTVAVFAVCLLGGALIVLGPGEALLSLVPHPNATTRYILETVAGVAMLAAAVYLWRGRERLGERSRAAPPPKMNRSSALLGATIAVVELPTAFPYFAAIAAIVGADLGPVRSVTLLFLFNVCFVLPLLAIVGTLTFAPDRAERVLAVGRVFLQRHWPTVLAVLALAAGVFVVLLGVTGLEASHSRFLRGLHHTLHG